MTDLTVLVQHGAANASVLISSALVLGALHGLEPGHSKTMMAAFIVAVRGTAGQAVLLATAATLSHTAIVWVIALFGMYFSAQISAESVEPYLQTASGVLILGIAAWMLLRVRKDQRRAEEGTRHHHHSHDDEGRRVDTGHGHVTLEIFERDVPPRWRLRTENGHRWHADEILVETRRPGEQPQVFRFIEKGSYAESVDEIPEPHEFTVRLMLGHGGHTHDYNLEFREHDHDHHHDYDHEHHHDHHRHDQGIPHDHGHHHRKLEGLNVSSAEFDDAHQRAHADDIRRRFTNNHVTTGQIVMFGLTGGLIPCGAAITVLLLCLQLKKFVLGVLLVLCFSIGLAATLMASGVIAAWGTTHLGKHMTNMRFRKFAQVAPYLSGGVVVALGVYVTLSGLVHLR